MKVCKHATALRTAIDERFDALTPRRRLAPIETSAPHARVDLELKRRTIADLRPVFQHRDIGNRRCQLMLRSNFQGFARKRRENNDATLHTRCTQCSSLFRSRYTKRVRIEWLERTNYALGAESVRICFHHR